MRLVLFLFPAALLLAGCGGSSNSSSVASGNVMQTVQISEKEFSLTPSTVTLSKTGTYAFRITNNGTITHALEIEGNGVEEKSGDIQAGSSVTLTATFGRNGSYEIYCPIDGHKAQGMRGTLTVGTGTGNSGTTTEGETTTTTSKIPGY
jgi:plastocyanin